MSSAFHAAAAGVCKAANPKLPKALEALRGSLPTQMPMSASYSPSGREQFSCQGAKICINQVLGDVGIRIGDVLWKLSGEAFRPRSQCRRAIFPCNLQAGSSFLVWCQGCGNLHQPGIWRCGFRFGDVDMYLQEAGKEKMQPAIYIYIYIS